MHPIILKAFNTTLGEISNSDFILLFIDISEEEEIVFRKLTASNQILKQIAPKVPLLICINKVDKSEESRVEEGKRLVDRKSTRLNSSHRCISYAVFCLKKKK